MQGCATLVPANAPAKKKNDLDVMRSDSILIRHRYLNACMKKYPSLTVPIVIALLIICLGICTTRIRKLAMNLITLRIKTLETMFGWLFRKYFRDNYCTKAENKDSLRYKKSILLQLEKISQSIETEVRRDPPVFANQVF